MKTAILLFALAGVATATLRVQTNPTHYGDPATGCQSDEQPVQITGVAGDVCTPQCDASTGQCPTDVPDGVTATPTCALQTTAGAKYCALLCSPSDDWDSLRAGDAQCGQATCKAIQSVGICTYDDVTKSDFESWRIKHGYANLWNKDAGEYMRRLSIWKKNMAKIAKHNAEVGNNWSMKMNEFGHLTSQEFTEQYTGYAKQQVNMDVPRTPFVSRVRKEDLADSVDWTTKGAVTPVKNQGSCGSCWSFSTTGGMEGSYFVKNGNLVSFSEQQLVSCDKVDSGCNGGLMDNAFKWVEGNGGLCSEADYPYTSGSGSTGICKSSCTAVSGSTISSFTDVSPSPQVTPATQANMEAAVSQQPISVAIEADQSSFQFYSSGVMTGTCGTQLDHGVLVVGYGTSGGTDYWKVKNSWGASWGMNGYILLQRGKSQRGGQCGVLLSASYPSF